MKKMQITIFFNSIISCLVLYFLMHFCYCSSEFCNLESQCGQENNLNDRYILYDVNPPEGFNLRRDVYMRFAVLAHKLSKSKNDKLNNFKLVLPPWSHLFHWKYDPEPEQIPWGSFFDVESLKRFAPVIEMYEFFDAINKTYSVVVDEVYILQHFKDMFETGNFKDRMKIDHCTQTYNINYFYYKNVTSNNVKCLSYHGPATKLSDLLLKSSAKVIMFHHAEVALHDMFGNQLYWQCRRSMRFSEELTQIAKDFRKIVLNSTDAADNTELPQNWQDEKAQRNAIGGPYLSVHLRRQDFARARNNQVPSLEDAAEQIMDLLKKLKLTRVFIATDASPAEYELLIKKISNSNIVRYIPSEEVLAKYKDGGVAIIDQIICAHGRHFVGTHESTFSFRIQEEREILGFPAKTTFNCFCKANVECPQPTQWKIIH